MERIKLNVSGTETARKGDNESKYTVMLEFSMNEETNRHIKLLITKAKNKKNVEFKRTSVHASHLRDAVALQMTFVAFRMFFNDTVQ